MNPKKKSELPVAKKGFTLIELLVVVAILALVGGIVIVGYDGLVARSANATAANTIASLTNAIRSYEVLERSLPDNLETLLSVNVASGSTTFDSSRGDNIASAYGAAISPSLSGILHPELASRLVPISLTLEQRANLRAAGIRRLRYLDRRGEDLGGSLDIRAGDGSAATVGPLESISVPMLAFDVPAPGTAANLGRGFALDLDAITNDFRPHAAGWRPGTGGYENVRIGASPTATLIALGIGKNSSLVSQPGGAGNPTGTARLANAPYYGDVARNQYNHYLLLIDVDQSPARVVAIVDARGRGAAENFAASQGQ
jgi:prepilin-type N-terminal cleavage/methylation domain-containing protein